MQYIDEQPILKPSFVFDKIKDCPDTAVITWQHGFAKAIEKYPHQQKTIMLLGVPVPVFNVRFEEESLIFVHIPLGSPAVAMAIELLHCMGVENFVFCGTCGIFDKKLDDVVIVPDKALRDEGTSISYLKKPEEFVLVKNYQKVSNWLSKMNVSNVIASVWTTDAIFRETPSAIKFAQSKGCKVVDMECSAIMAVSDYLKVNAYQFFFSSDSFEKGSWKKFSVTHHCDNPYDYYLDLALKIALCADKEGE